MKYLRINDIRSDEGRYFSSVSLLKYLRENDERLYKTTHRYFARIILSIEKEKSVIASFKFIIAIITNRLFRFKVDISKDEFMNGTPVFKSVAVNQEKENTYKYNNLEIELDSVHGVKGQTHTATLYMETFYFSKTNESIIKYLIGEKSSTIEEHVEKHIRVAYVAMTRPTDLLCIVLNEEIYLENKVELSDLGGYIIEK